MERANACDLQCGEGGLIDLLFQLQLLYLSVFAAPDFLEGDNHLLQGSVLCDGTPKPAAYLTIIY